MVTDNEPTFRTDLFHGAAEDYDRYRLRYPDELLADVRRHVDLGPTARVLDLACGTGQIALAVAPHVDAVHAVDQEPDMVEVGRRTADRAGLVNLAWTVGAAETVELHGPYDLATIGNAFHRLRRQAVANRVATHLHERGVLALLWTGSPADGDAPWQQTLRAAVESWMDRAEDGGRLPANWAEPIERVPHEAVLERAGLTDGRTIEVRVDHVWTVDALIGFHYGTSILSRAALGARAEAFAADLRERLLTCDPAGTYTQALTFVAQVARRPT